MSWQHYFINCSSFNSFLYLIILLCSFFSSSSKLMYVENVKPMINIAFHEFWKQHMWPLLKIGGGIPSERGVSVVASLSARVGSIGDNRLGGWHSYRSSKAALNQCMTDFFFIISANCLVILILWIQYKHNCTYCFI